jgi:hypothetical protein
MLATVKSAVDFITVRTDCKFNVLEMFLRDQTSGPTGVLCLQKGNLADCRIAWASREIAATAEFADLKP